MSWINLDVVVEKIKNRKFFWHRAPNMKYVNIRIDMRDGRCILTDRNGELIADNEEGLIELFDKLNSEADDSDAGLYEVQKNLEDLKD